MGKSTLYRKHFGPAKYEHINQDVLGNRTKCINATKEALSKGKSCVIGTCLRRRSFLAADHIAIQTTRIETGKRGSTLLTLRKSLRSQSGKCDWVFTLHIEFYLRIRLPARCFKFENSIDLAWHNNMYRTYCLASSTLENEVSALV
jgi:bifunctional polynucleotide phosphatase/kinase